MKLRDVFLREATYRVHCTRGICWKDERGRIRKTKEKKRRKRGRKGRLPRPYNDRGRSEEKGGQKSRYLKLHGSFYYLSPAISASTRSRIFWPGDRSMICAAASRIRRRSIGRHRSPASPLAISVLLSARAEKMEKAVASPSLYSTLLSQKKKGDYTSYLRLIFSHRTDRYLPVKPRLPRHRLRRREVFQRSLLLKGERGCC